DAVADTDVEEPLHRAVRGAVLREDRGLADLGQDFEFLAKRLREIRHPVEVIDSTLVDPLEELARAKRLLALRGDPRGERGEAHVQKVDLLHLSPPSTFYLAPSTGCKPGAPERNTRSRRARSRGRRSRARHSRRWIARSPRGSCRPRPSSDRSRP